MRSTTSALVFALILGACSGSAEPSVPIIDAPASADTSLPPASAPVVEDVPTTAGPTTTSTTTTTTTSPTSPGPVPISDPTAIDVATLSLDEVDRLLTELDDLLADLDDSFNQQEGVDIDG